MPYPLHHRATFYYATLANTFCFLSEYVVVVSYNYEKIASFCGDKVWVSMNPTKGVSFHRICDDPIPSQLLDPPLLSHEPRHRMMMMMD